MERSWVVSLTVLLALGGSAAAHAGETGTATLKANLDLPVSGLLRADEEETEEIGKIIFYGQVFEGDAIVFVCDRMG